MCMAWISRHAQIRSGRANLILSPSPISNSSARCSDATILGTAGPTGNAGHRAEPRRSCSATAPPWQPLWGSASHGPAEPLATLPLGITDCAVTADLSSWDSGGARRTTCQSKHLKAPQTAGSDGAAGRSSSAEPGGWDVSLGILSTPQSCPKMCGVRHRNDHGFL